MEVRPGYRLSEVGVIPKDWSTASLGSVAHIKTGSRNNQDKVRDGAYPFFVRSATVERINTFSYACEAILVPGEGGIGSIFHYINGRFEVHQRVYAIREFVPGVSGRFVYFYMAAHFGSHAMRNSVKATVDSLRLPTFENFPVPIPPTKAEQEAIAEALGDADSLIESLQQLLAKKRQLKQGAMSELLTGERRLPGFSGEWEVTRLGAMLKFQVGFPFRSTFFNEDDQGIRLVKNRDLKSDDQVFCYSGAFGQEFLVRDGDVLVGMDGDFFPCLWDKGPALLNQRVGRIVPLSGLDRVFALYYLVEPLREIENATSSTTVKHLSHGDIEGIERALPRFDEQTAIAAILSNMDAEIAALEAKVTKARQLKQGMMQELLTGKIRLV